MLFLRSDKYQPWQKKACQRTQFQPQKMDSEKYYHMQGGVPG